MSDVKTLEKDGFGFAKRAVQCDSQGLVDAAIFYYSEASAALMAAVTAGSCIPNASDKAKEYQDRAEQLKANKGSVTAFGQPTISKEQLMVGRAQFLLNDAFESDEKGEAEEALELYTQAAELFLEVRKLTTDKDFISKAEKMAIKSLDRAEAVKGKHQPQKPSISSTHLPTQSPIASVSKGLGPLGLSLREENRNEEAATGGRAREQTKGGRGEGGEYSEEELQVLRVTSNINDRKYVPFLDLDRMDKLPSPVPYKDEHGMLSLSTKQKAKFGRWVWPVEVCNDPQMIHAVSCMAIRQNTVSDCSFVASLAITAHYEHRFQTKLITNIIYPQNKNGEPQYNPCGKYMVKLKINGVHRKVIVDDYLPLSKDSQLLCSYSNNHNEFWVSILEKAYMKVMGGYDFPGSNSNIDLHALTGWIPERIGICVGKDEFNRERKFERISNRFRQGHCLVTMATGEINQEEADLTGLVPTHAYAMLDARVAKGYKLFKLKNPWSHFCWRGKFSALDTQHWTSDLRKELNYDPERAEKDNNGVFWIDYDSLMKCFDVIYINWKPELFSYSTCIHSTWTAKAGPKKDSYNIGDNPQYRLEVKSPSPSGVWILLTRHITDKEDFANNREFITLLVYKSGGKRVYYPYDPPPFKDGVRINSPHYLCKMKEKGDTYTLVVSQYEKNNSLHYTLSVYATCEFSLAKIKEPYNPQYEKQMTGEWKGRTAGGCANYPDTHNNNPIYQVKVDNNSTTSQLLIKLKGPKQYSVGFEVTNASDLPSSFTKKTSGDFRRGFCVLELDSLVGGVYNIMPCTFHAGKEGHFFLDISSSSPIKVQHLQ